MKDESQTAMNPNIAPTQSHQKPSLRPPLIASENEPEKQEEGFIASLRKLMANARSSLLEISSNVFWGFKRKQLSSHYQNGTVGMQLKINFVGWRIVNYTLLTHCQSHREVQVTNITKHKRANNSL